MTTLTKTFQPSKYQQAVFDFLQSSNKNLIIKATAGSGKTTTIVEAAKLVKGKSLFLAFNRHIVAELKSRLPVNFDCKTVHGICYGVLKRRVRFGDVNTKKYESYCRTIAENIIASNVSDIEGLTIYNLAEEICKLVKFCQLTLTDPADARAVYAMVDNFSLDIDYAPLSVPVLYDILNWGHDQTLRGNLDYNDMIYFPLLWNLPFPKYDNIFVDEAQDLNSAQTEVLIRVRNSNGRIVAVGDSSQAIYKFAGANSNSLEYIQSRIAAEKLPLSICYRCPTSHIKLAQEFDSSIEPRPNAPEGELTFTTEEKINANVKKGDLIICRTMAPLISKCLQLIAEKKNAKVRGRNISKQLTSIVTEVSEMVNFNYAEFGEYLEMWSVAKLNRLASSKASDEVIQSYIDRVEGIKACYQGMAECKNVKELNKSIDKLFSDNDADIWLSTIHGTKGLEADTVIVLNYNRMPLRWKNQSASDLTQEYNLKFIALTRSKHSLVLCNE